MSQKLHWPSFLSCHRKCLSNIEGVDEMLPLLILLVALPTRQYFPGIYHLRWTKQASTALGRFRRGEQAASVHTLRKSHFTLYSSKSWHATQHMTIACPIGLFHQSDLHVMADSVMSPDSGLIQPMQTRCMYTCAQNAMAPSTLHVTLVGFSMAMRGAVMQAVIKHVCMRACVACALCLGITSKAHR